MPHYYRRSPSVAGRVIDGEAVLVKIPENVLYVLNRSAARLWVGADGTRGAEGLAGGGDTRPVIGFLEEMVSRGLMERLAAPLERAEAFPQRGAAAGTREPDEPPRIAGPERVELAAGCGLTVLDCQTKSPVSTFGAPPPPGAPPEMPP